MLITHDRARESPAAPLAAGPNRLSGYQPAVQTANKDLVAKTNNEFACLLRQLQIRSGAPVRTIAARAGIPRSQAYALINTNRTVLPTQLDQVVAFVRACGLSLEQTERVKTLWTALQEPLLPTPEQPVLATRQGVANDTTPIPQTPAVTPSRGAEDIVHELNDLRRGRGVNAANIATRIGPRLRTACAVTDADGAEQIRRKVVSRLTAFCRLLPTDLELAATVALALRHEAAGEFLDRRIAWLADHFDRDPRTARRRVDTAFRLLSECIDDERGMTGKETFGAELRRRRQLAGYSLARFGELVHYTKGYLSKIESGAQTAHPALARLCDAALKADGALVALVAPTHEDETGGGEPSTGYWNMSLQPDGSGHFTPMFGPAEQLGIGMSVEADRQAVDPAGVVALFETRLDATRVLGQQVSAQLVLPKLIADTHTLRSIAISTLEGAEPLWQMAARYAEYVGWMCQEGGNVDQALWWTRMAVQMGERGGDESWRPFALVREAEMAMYTDDGRRTVRLAQMAQADAAATTRVRGLAAKREAQGHALLGDREACELALDRSAELLAEAGHGSAPPMQGTWTTPDATLMARGWCLLDLGRPGEATEALELGMRGFSDGTRRDRVRWAMRCALANAMADEIVRACEIVEEFASDLRQLDSASARHDVRLLQREFRRRSNTPRVRDLISVLADL